ncbi:MAG: glycosyltransferase family 39 protein [Acidimicrobiia bacterium]
MEFPPEGPSDRGRDLAARAARATTVAVAVGALAALALGAMSPVRGAAPPSGTFALHATLSWWLRIVLTLCGVLCAVLAPGLLVRRFVSEDSAWRSTGVVWIPGFLYLVVTGLVSWGLAAYLDVASVAGAFAVVPPVLLLAALARGWKEILFTRGERAVVVVMLLLVAIAIGKATWSQGPTDELYGGTVSRTLEVGDRSDSRIPYHGVQLVANAVAPYSDLGKSYYAPWLFSDRSPMAGLASATAVFTSGAQPPQSMPNQAWVPFDAQGFAAYRIAMIVFAASVVLSLYGLLRPRVSEERALAAVIFVAMTPFIVHEVYFTWPKLLSASFLLVAASLLLMRRPLLSGLVVGLAFLAHPAAIFALPGLVLGWLVVGHRGSHLVPEGSPPPGRFVDRVGAAMLTLLGTAVVFLAWRIGNRGHLTNTFVDYLKMADGNVGGQFADWIRSRMASLANSFVPFRVLVADHANREISSPSGPRTIVKVGFLYWTTVPFGVGLVVFPVYLFGLWRFAVRHARYFVAIIVTPLVVFWLYWGFSITGLLREGLHAWLIATLIAAFLGLVLLSSRRVLVVLRYCASARVASLVVMLCVPTVASSGWLDGRRFLVSNLLSLTLLFGGVLGLGIASARWLDPDRLASPGADRTAIAG